MPAPTIVGGGIWVLWPRSG